MMNGKGESWLNKWTADQTELVDLINAIIMLTVIISIYQSIAAMLYQGVNRKPDS